MATIRARFTGGQRYQAALDAINLKEHPEVLRKSLLDTARFGVRQAKRQMRGPRPRQLQGVTGDSARSLAVSTRRLPRAVEWGSPEEYLLLYEVREDGKWKDREILAPTVQEVRVYAQEQILENWENQLRGLPSGSGTTRVAA